MQLRFLHRVLLAPLVAALLLAVGLGAYAVHVRARAAALINSAQRIRSTTDAEREIGEWRKRSGSAFWQESDHLGGDHNYDGQIENLLLARLGVVQPAAVTLSVTMHGGELKCITLIMIAGRRPTATPSVWVQEWFDQDMPPRLRVNEKNRPWGAIVEFSASVPEITRDRALMFNTKCFLQFSGCKSAEDILPGVWQMGAPLSGNLWQGSAIGSPVWRN